MSFDSLTKSFSDVQNGAVEMCANLSAALHEFSYRLYGDLTTFDYEQFEETFIPANDHKSSFSSWF